MKRTAEVVLGIIGALVFSFFSVMGGVLIWFKNNQGAVEDLYNNLVIENPKLEASMDLQTFMESMTTGGTFLLITNLIAVILGIVAMVFLKGNKKPKIAGVIFIATAVLFTVIQVGIAMFAGFFYVIAGIMCLVRKPKQPLFDVKED